MLRAQRPELRDVEDQPFFVELDPARAPSRDAARPAVSTC
jgi:hypothetical protein